MRHPFYIGLLEILSCTGICRNTLLNHLQQVFPSPHLPKLDLLVFILVLVNGLSPSASSSGFTHLCIREILPMMEYKRPVVESLFNLRSFDVIDRSLKPRNDDSVELRLETPCEQSEAGTRSSITGPTITARLDPDHVIFPVRLPSDSQAGHCQYISLELTHTDLSKLHRTRSYHHVTVQTFTSVNHDKQDSRQFDSRIETGLDVRLVKGDRGWRMYITDPEQKSYGTMNEVTRDKCWLEGKNVDKRRTLHIANDGSLFFQDDKKMWHGFTPSRKDKRTDQDDGGCCSAFECMRL
jgi:hypothetical protein